MASAELEKKDLSMGAEELDNEQEPMEDEDEENEEDDVDEGEDFIVEVGSTYSCRRADGSYHDAEVMKTRMNKQAGREEFFVRYVGLARRQNEWVDKTRLVLPKPVNEEEAVNGTDKEAENSPKKQKTEESEPEAKKAKVEVQETNNSVKQSGDFAEELTCMLCKKLFEDPVMVECGHNFCRSCMEKAWVGQDSFTCPDCKEVITEKRFTTNRALANLVKKAAGNATPVATPSKPAAKPVAKPAEKGKAPVQENCPDHDEKLKLYCKDDGILSCIICRDSLKHANHNFLPILDAVGVYRTELAAIVSPLEEALKVTEQLTEQQNEKIQQHNTNMNEYQEHIEAEFEKLHAFLKEQEEKLLEQLEEQGDTLLKEMEANQVKMQENKDNIQQTIGVAKERMEESNSIAFLTDIKAFIEKCQEQQKEAMSSGNTLLTKDLCQATFKGPIQYSVWKKMKTVISPYLTPMLLDPASAHPNLILSDGLTSVKYSDSKLPLPDNPKRFSQCILVLGSEGFDSGRHYWEVDVADKTAWDVGMASESSNRKGKIKLNPKNGYWAIWLRNGNAYKALESPSKTLTLANKPKKIGVYVDYEGGQISFYNADDMTAIYTFTATFTEKLFPYLSPFLHESGRNSDALQQRSYNRKDGGSLYWSQIVNTFHPPPHSDPHPAMATDTDKNALALGEEEADEEIMEDEEEIEEEDDEVAEDFTVEVGGTYSCRRADGTYHDGEVMKTRMNKQAGREEYFVRYIGLARRQNEWIDKTRITPKQEEQQEEEEDLANGTDQTSSDNEKTPKKRPNQEPEHEAKKAKVEVAPELAEELTCMLCSKLFEDPVMVECGHNYCRSCVEKAWVGQDSFTCPDCQEVITEKRFTTNRALANMVKKAAGPVTPAGTGKARCPENCPVHDEKLKLYCKDDGILSCVICRDSLVHAGHQFLPIQDAASVYRAELSTVISPVEEALKITEQLYDQQKEKIDQHKINVIEYRKNLASEFEKLNDFLKVRKQKLLEQLREQGKNLLREMEANVTQIRENRDGIQETIGVAKDRMDDTDSISFLTDIKAFIEKCQEQQKSVTATSNALMEKELCKGTFMGPIQYSMWKLMKSVIVPHLTPMFLDPNSAHPNLLLSDGLTSVKYVDNKLPLPDNPKRFSQCILVLGSDGFDSGRHYWEVDVADKTAWDVGVASESSNRKGKIKLNPKNGYWAIWLRNGNAYKALESPSKTLTLANKPKKIGVYLDYEGGQISFYNADDMTAIYTFTATFTEKLYPYLSPFLHDSGRNADPLRFVNN
ncbi:uncharacterized protein PAF06_013882 [Gastrophryne carolinensis]